MSQENIAELLKKASQDEQLKARLEKADNFAAIQAISKKCGLAIDDVKEEEVANLIAAATGALAGELSDKELEELAGGISTFGTFGTKGILILEDEGRIKPKSSWEEGVAAAKDPRRK